MHRVKKVANALSVDAREANACTNLAEKETAEYRCSRPPPQSSRAQTISEAKLTRRVHD